MRILFFTPYFPPEIGAPQTRTHELALRLVKMGHEVSVLTTFPSYPSGTVPPEWRGHFFWKGSDQGIGIYRIWSYAVPNRGFFKRLLGQLSFAVFASCAGGMVPRTDVIIVESHPLFNGLAGIFLSWCKRAPYVLNVSDLWPESAIQMGMLKNRFLIWASKRMEYMAYRYAVLVLAMTGGIYESILRDGIELGRVLLFRNAVDAEVFRPQREDAFFRAALGVPADAFVAVYAGTFGMFNHVTAILETAAQFQREGNQRIRFVLAGDGGEKDKLKAKAAEMGLRNVHFVGPFPKAQMPKLLNTADCVVIALWDLELSRGALPTKLFEAMSCAKPVVLAACGEAEVLVTEAQAALCVKPEDCAGIHNAILQLRNHPAEAQAMGRRGREYVKLHFNRDRRAEELNRHLERLAG